MQSGEVLVFGDVKCPLHIGPGAPVAVSTADLVVDTDTQVAWYTGDSCDLSICKAGAQPRGKDWTLISAHVLCSALDPLQRGSPLP